MQNLQLPLKEGVVMKIAVCKTCGISFEPKTKLFKTCSQKCSNKLKIKRDTITKRKYYLKNKQKIINKVNEYRKKYPEKEKQYRIKYKSKNKKNILEYETKRRNTEKYRIYINKYRRERRKIDILFKLRIDLSKRLSDDLFNYLNQNKKHSTLSYVNFSINKLKEHLESQFTSEMNWQNHGTVWDIGHRIPSSWAKNEYEMKNIIYNLNNFFPIKSNFNRYIQRDNFAILNNTEIYNKKDAIYLFKNIYGID